MPREHGGWGLTLEPVLLGLLVAPSSAGAAVGVATFLGFLARTPAKVVLVDRWRRRVLARTRTAAAILAVELALLTVAVAVAVVAAGWNWLLPFLVATPLYAVETWYAMRSRARRLAPELAGAVGISAAACSIALAGGASARLATALSIVLAARSIAAIPHARAEIARLHGRTESPAVVALAQAGAVAAAVAAVVVRPSVVAGSVAVCLAVGVHTWWSRRPVRPALVVGLFQTALGLVVVLATAIGVHAA